MDLQLQAEILLEGLNEIKLKNNDILTKIINRLKKINGIDKVTRE